MKQYATFVLRILLSEEQDSFVEGQISHVGSQKTVYFRDLEKAMTFITEHLEATVDQGPRGQTNGKTVLPEREEHDTSGS